MGRLIVEAVSGESRFVDVAGRLVLFVSVTRQEDGTPVLGLKAQHFRIAAPAGSVYGLVLEGVEEARWEGVQPESAGCYSLNIALQSDKSSDTREWIEGEFYPFAIQVRFTEPGSQAHIGQAVVRVESLGK
ncbi:MAG TPA: hypothetical protein VEZ88_07655 [Steroidobacteraceae bacterium]|nr:hypothetical protein [Steroidobacteraceae bacterium]